MNKSWALNVRVSYKLIEYRLHMGHALRLLKWVRVLLRGEHGFKKLKAGKDLILHSRNLGPEKGTDMLMVRQLGTGRQGASCNSFSLPAPTLPPGLAVRISIKQGRHRFTSWICVACVSVILMETLCHLEEMYYCDVCSYSLCILATYLAFLCQVFNAFSFRVLAFREYWLENTRRS